MKIGLLFPGYSSQSVGMAKELYDESRVMQEYFEEASSCLPINFVKLCFASSEAELSKIEHAYPAIFLVSYSIAQILKEKGIKPAVVAGFCTGELAAIAYADGISFPDGLYLLAKYAQLFQEALDNWQVKALLIKNIAAVDLKKILNQLNNQQSFGAIAVYLSETEHIIAGHEKIIVDVEQIVQTQYNALVKPYSIGIGLHSAMMDPVIMYLAKYLEKIDFKDAQLPIVMSTDGQLCTEKAAIARRFMHQIQAPVQWHKVLKSYADIDIIMQIGPGKMLADFAKDMYPTKTIITINKPSDLTALENIMYAKKDE